MLIPLPPLFGADHETYIEVLLKATAVGALGIFGTVAARTESSDDYSPSPM